MNAVFEITKSQHMKYADALHVYFVGRQRNVKVSGDWIGRVFKLNIEDREFFTSKEAGKYLNGVFEQMQAPVESGIELEAAI